MATTTVRSKLIDSNRPQARVNHIEIDIGAGETSPPIYVYSKRCTVTLIPGGSGGKIQYTTSSPARVEGDTATWIDWDRGSITDAASDIPEGPITALRAVDAGDGSTLECLLVNEV